MNRFKQVVFASFATLLACHSGPNIPSVQFEKGRTYNVGHSTYAVDVGDLNNDGKMDLAVANYNLDTLAVLLGKGDGTFIMQPPLSLEGHHNKIRIKDVNGDGKPDLLVRSDTQGVRVLVGNGSGQFELSKDDALMQSVKATVSSGEDRNFLEGTSADLNGDGLLDRVEPLTFSDKGPAEVSLKSFLMVADDLRGIGRVSVYIANAQKNLVQKNTYKAGHWPKNIAIEDLNGDHHPDIVTANYRSNDLTILLGRGDGSFISGPTVKAGDRPSDVAIGDFNQDGRNDLAVAHWGGSTVNIFVNQGGKGK